MCGVWAQIQFNKKIQEQDLVFPIRQLSHRGPDGYGWFADDQVALVHTRLSIIDLSGGVQPLKSHDEALWGVVNGELYDYKHTRTHMQQQGIQFRTQSDSEVLLNLFRTQGKAGLTSATGEFAFIFYDPRQKILCFGRDQHGVKPLFYQWTSEAFTLSSEVKALSSEKPQLDETYIKRFLARAMVPPRTAIKGALHVLPGRLYTFDIETQKLSWEAFQPLPLFHKRDLDQNEALEQTTRELSAAVRRRLVADVEVGCYLSGGIDSALIAALAVQEGAKPKAFTVGFADRDFDETAKAAEIAQHLGLEHSVVTMTGKNFFPHLIQSIVAFENPISNPHGAAKNLLSHHASQSVKVVLSGEGSDEWFGGYAYLRIQKLQRFLKTHPRLAGDSVKQFLLQEPGAGKRHLDGSSTFNDSQIGRYFDGHVPAILSRLCKHRLFRYITNDNMTIVLDEICKDLALYLTEENPEFANNKSSWDFNSWMSLRTDLLHYILANVGDRQEMSHSLEGRTPFMDPAVVAVASRTKENVLLSALSEKHILRAVGRPLLPASVIERRKHPFFAPMKYLYLREARHGMDDYIKVAEQNTPWLNWPHLKRLLAKESLGSDSVFEGLAISLKLMLFSMGVLVQDLRRDNIREPRGYRLPVTDHDILQARRT